MDNENVLLARQPIYDKKREVAAYELLFRPTEGESFASLGGTVATSRVLLNAFADNEIEAITSGLPAFVNFTEELIHTPPPFSSEHLVIEILEDIPVTPELIAGITKLKKLGFKIALDDYIPDPSLEPLLALADIIKLELPAIKEDDLPHVVESLKPYNATLLAEKIEDYATFKRCKDLGCELFQGFFLSKPILVKGKKMPQNKMAIMQLLGQVQDPEIEIKQLVEVIKQDPMLSFKLLKLVNSAAYQRSNEVETIQKAVMILGLAKIKSWATLLSLSSLEDKPSSLKQLALQRARFCELIAEHLEPKQSDLYFTAGLLSCLDGFLDQSLSDILSSLPLDPTLNDALLSYQGLPGLALRTLLLYEKSLWGAIDWQELQKVEIDKAVLCQIYLASIEWADNLKTI